MGSVLERGTVSWESRGRYVEGSFKDAKKMEKGPQQGLREWCEAICMNREKEGKLEQRKKNGEDVTNDDGKIDNSKCSESRSKLKIGARKAKGK